MRISAITFTLIWLTTAGAAIAEPEPYSTQIQIIGKETGPYSIGANVKPIGSNKRPYKMDRSKDITNEDLSRIMETLAPFDPHPFVRQLDADDFKKSLDDLDESLEKAKHDNQSVGPHPETTAVISDPPNTVQELDPIVERPEYDDEHYRNLDAILHRARNDLNEAEDRLAGARDEPSRQQAIRDIEGARQRIQNATNAAP